MRTAAVLWTAALMGAVAISASGGPAQPVDELWALEHLIAVPQEDVPKIIARLETDGGEADDHTKLALGILHVHQYIWHGKRGDSTKAEDYLSSLSTQVGNTPLALVYRGMSSSFLAKRRTIFGVGDLKDMRRFFESIPEDHPSWFIRFLRGTTLYQVGEALPSIWPLTEHKRAARKLGKSDLEYVLSRHRESPAARFDRRLYSDSNGPVPETVQRKILKLLNDS